jgi:hypothetical protein
VAEFEYVLLELPGFVTPTESSWIQYRHMPVCPCSVCGGRLANWKSLPENFCVSTPPKMTEPPLLTSLDPRATLKARLELMPCS